jgi:hypothetical protein
MEAQGTDPSIQPAGVQLISTSSSRNEACSWLQPTAEENHSQEAVQRPGKKAKQTAAWLQPAAGSESIHHQAPGSKQKRALSTTEVTGWLQPSASGQE